MSAHLDAEQLASLALGAAAATGGASGSDGGASEAEARAHLASCPACQRELLATEQLLRDVAAMPAPQPSPASLERIRLAVRSEIARESARAGGIDRVTAAVIATVGLIALWALGDFTALATIDVADVARWALALASMGGAVAIGLFAPRSLATAARGLAAALGAAATLAVIDLMIVPPGVGEHLGCEFVLMLVASAPLVTAALSVRRRVADGASASEATLQAAAGAGAGALAGQAALFTTCSSPEGLLHIAVFHLLTFVGIVAAGALLGRAAHLLTPRPA